MAEDITKVEPDSPNRCQAVTSKGQCLNSKAVGSQYCAVHHNGIADEKRALHSYRLDRWRAELDHHTDADTVRTVVGEIGVLRLTLEAVLNQCNDANTLLIHSNRIGDLSSRIEKAVSSLIRLEERTGASLSKDKVLQIAGRFIDIITDHVDDPAVLEAIADGFVDVVNDPMIRGSGI